MGPSPRGLLPSPDSKGTCWSRGLARPAHLSRPQLRTKGSEVTTGLQLRAWLWDLSILEISSRGLGKHSPLTFLRDPRLPPLSSAELKKKSGPRAFHSQDL